MEEPHRSQILEAFKIFCEQFDQSVLRARADLQSGLPLEDLLAGGGAEFAKGDKESLAFTAVALILREARKPVKATRKKTAVVAKRSTKFKEIPDDAV